jgi:hypothetical protein
MSNQKRNNGMAEYWKKTLAEGGRIDRRTAIRRPSQSRYWSFPIIPAFPYSNIPACHAVAFA